VRDALARVADQVYVLPKELQEAAELLLAFSASTNQPVRIFFDRDTLWCDVEQGLQIRIRMRRVNLDKILGQ